MRNRWPWLWRFLCRLCTPSGASRQRHLYVGAQEDDLGELRRNIGSRGIKVGFGKEKSRRNSSRLEQRPRRRRLRWWRLLYNRSGKKAEDGGGRRRKPFVWRENPSMIKQAVEGGWAAFSFALTTYSRSSISRSGEDEPPKIWWEMHELDQEEEEEEEGRGRVVVMQKLCLNPGLAPAQEDQVGFVQALHSALPLPGPPDLFPSQAYFEITILALDHHQQRSSLLPQQRKHEVHPFFPAFVATATSTVHDDGLQSNDSKKQRTARSSNPSSSSTSSPVDASTTAPLKAFNAIACDAAAKEKEEDAALQKLETSNSKILAIGLVGDVDSTRNSRRRSSEVVDLDLFPGDTFASAGWRSDGRIFVNGAELKIDHRSHLHSAEPSTHDVDGTESAAAPTTVGCGFDPASRTVFFTLNGSLTHRTGTLGREFGYPLYPAVAANYAVCLRPNFGQTPFLYLQANHVPRIIPNSRKPKIGFVMEDEEDSGELFSLPRRIGSMRWHSDRHPPPSDVESDRFDIVLDI